MIMIMKKEEREILSQYVMFAFITVKRTVDGYLGARDLYRKTVPLSTLFFFLSFFFF